MYLVEALKHDVPAFHEDRLTQIVAATFNESRRFQKLFLEFLRVPHVDALFAKTQVTNENAPSRPDLILLKKEKPYLVIESKIDARSCKNQQNRHALLKAKYYFLIARDPVHKENVGRGFVKLAWADFFAFLSGKLPALTDPLDSFLVMKLISYGRECNMVLPERITTEDFNNACEFLAQVRLKSSPRRGFDRSNPFQSLERISKFLERVLMKIKDDPVIALRLRPFQARLTFTFATCESTDRAILKEPDRILRRELYLKSDTLTLEKHIKLRKSINGKKELYVRASFVPRHNGRSLDFASVSTLKKTKLNRIRYICEIASGFSDLDRCYHDQVVYEGNAGTKDLEFSEFYGEAVKEWRRTLNGRKR